MWECWGCCGGEMGRTPNMQRYLIGGMILASAVVVAMPSMAQTVIAEAASGTADAGIASRPISNIAANDSVGGAQATLGSSGNATVAEVGTWTTGIGLDPTNGNVSTTVAVPAGVYRIAYQLCAKSAPTDCAGATDTVTVINSAIVANVQSGTADAGLASQPITNIVATDTVNGARATLGSTGNSTVAKVGTWAKGLGLNPSTGNISTTVEVPPGVYSIPYKLCDLNRPPNCNSATDTVAVVTETIVANVINGKADFGIASQPIPNVAATDTINGASVVLGAGGTGVVAQVGTWPTGIALTPSTGTVSTTITLPNGVYPVTYELCDYNVPKKCERATDTVTVITASILANPQTGVASAGTASIAIPNTTATDAVDGNAVLLGASANAQISKAGTWPTGINLNAATGAVTVSAAVAEGVYDFEYQLCDLNVPPNCAAAQDEIAVTSAIIANPDSGVAVSGKGSAAITDVASNDTIDGRRALLNTTSKGTANASVSAVGTWPTGIALNTGTGAITVAASVQPGFYTVTYRLCQLGTSNCSVAQDTITVDSWLVVIPRAGGAVVGTGSTAIADVAADDFVNGAAVTLGSSGNATVSQLGSWPTGIALNISTGAVTTTTAAAGNYLLSYQVCDKNTPPDCASALVDVTVAAQPFAEQSISPYMTGDIEFDWARDGLYCPTCNFGVGNSQLNWTDRNNNLWVSGVNAATGAFTPVSGQGNGTPVDTVAYFWQDWGNGPEWAFSTPPGAPGGNPVSQLVYTRYLPGQQPVYPYTGVAIATLLDGAPTWSVAFFPGAFTPVSDNTILPEASQCPSAPATYAVFETLGSPTNPTQQMFTEPVSTGPGTAPTPTPFGSFSNGIGERWVPCTTWLTFQGDVTIGDNILQQVFWYDTSTQAVQQLTFDLTTKQRAVMFRAPEFGGNFALMTLAADAEIQIYEQLNNATYPNGAPVMTLVNTIYSPDPVEPNMFDPKIFVHCTALVPTCASYVVVGLSEVPNSQQTEQDPNGLAVTSIDPAHPMFQILVTAQSSPPTQRLDPKYFITSEYGPVLYYDRLLAVTETQEYQDEGIYMINLQLGLPAGPCVGSSAEGGLNLTWPNCTPGVAP
jgi:hypothetical protein